MWITYFLIWVTELVKTYTFDDNYLLDNTASLRRHWRNTVYSKHCQLMFIYNTDQKNLQSTLQVNRLNTLLF